MLLFVCIFALFNACCIAESKPDETAIKTEMDIDDVECTEDWCAQYSYTDLTNKYEGLFKTKLDYFMQQIVFHLDRDIILYDEGVKDLEYIVGSVGDGDSCCQTLVESHIYDTVQDIYKQPLKVVQLRKKEMFQFIPKARCVGIGSCDGECVLEESTISVLVYESGKTWFEPVLVPAYCSCKRN